MPGPACHKCNTPIDGTFVARGDSCTKCGADLKCCKNCRHYDPKAYNDCREPQAERVVDKERSNFCDYFSVALDGKIGAPGDEKKSILNKLDDLFKK